MNIPEQMTGSDNYEMKFGVTAVARIGGFYG
jgi:hypothetical protein